MTISKELVAFGYRNGVITLDIDPNMESGTIARCGDNWFYFGGLTAEEMNPDEYKANVPEEDIVAEIFAILDEDFHHDEAFRDEYDYYAAVLCDAYTDSVIKPKVLAAMDGILGLDKTPDGYCCELFADYRDEFDDKTITDILSADYPEETFSDKIHDVYFWTALDEQDHIMDEVKKKIAEESDDSLVSDFDDIIEDLVRDNMYVAYPEDHFLDQDVYINVMMDTGDGNYDYVLNSVYPHYDGDYDTPPEDKASLVWLAQTQGYNKDALWAALREGDMANPNGFLESVRVEVANMSSHMNTVTFLVRMPLRKAMELNRLIKLQTAKYDATQNSDCGTLVLDKSVECGLYDPWNGGGSCLEIQLEKDAEVPIKYIRSALPDGGDGHSIENVYGICGSAWKDVVKEVREPKTPEINEGVA